MLGLLDRDEVGVEETEERYAAGKLSSKGFLGEPDGLNCWGGDRCGIWPVMLTPGSDRVRFIGGAFIEGTKLTIDPDRTCDRGDAVRGRCFGGAGTQEGMVREVGKESPDGRRFGLYESSGSGGGRGEERNFIVSVSGTDCMMKI